MSESVLPPRYARLAALGKGGGGEVWSVEDRLTGRVVALKTLGEGADEREMQALVREAVALSGLEGLGVPRVLRFGTLAGGRAYMLRELVEGDSLADLVARAGERDGGGKPPVDPMLLLGAIAQAAEQLTKLHRAALLHGDIKPANIIVGMPDGKMRATLVDLGLAATWREGGAKAEGLTPRYAAPELFEGAALTVRAEVYALGATLAEVTTAIGDKLAPDVRAALDEIAVRATADDPAARHPSADELASALRRAARLGEPAQEQGGAAWPVVGLDGTATKLLAHVAALRPGGGIVVTGPHLSGRSVLLRRTAWSLGALGRAVVWVETAQVADAAEALTLELAAYPGTTDLVVVVDDADRLPEAQLVRLDELRSAGARLVLVVSAEGPPKTLPGPTFEIFAMPPLDARSAGELVRRIIPSLSDAVVAHVVGRAHGWPGRIRAIVRRLERAPVVSPADVDRLLVEEPVPSSRGDERSEIHRLLDKGHFEEAADLLRRYQDDPSPWMAIARSRLATNRGDTARAVAELDKVKDGVLAGSDDVLAAAWLLHAARAHLRAGDYGAAEQNARRVADRLAPASAAPAGELMVPGEGETLLSASQPRPAPVRETGSGRLHSPRSAVGVIAADALSVSGLAQSYAGRPDDAKTTLDQAVLLARASGDPRTLSVALASLGFAEQRVDHLGEAKVAYEEALLNAEKAGDAGSVASTRLNLASIAKTRGDLATALKHLEAAVDMGRRSGRIATLRQALLNLANLDLFLGRLARARASIDALAEQRADLPPQAFAQLCALEAEYAAHAGDLAEAERLCDECAHAYEAMGRPADAAEARLERVIFAADRPGADGAALLAAVAEVEQRLGDVSPHRALLALARARAAGVAGDEDKARAAYDEAHEAARASGQRDLSWRALAAKSQLELAAGQPLKARRDREAAVATLEEIAARLPRDLREVFWNDPRRAQLRAAALRDLSGGMTVAAPPPNEDRLARVLEINREIAGEYDLTRLLERVTDHAIALLRAERGFVILRHDRDRDGAADPTTAPSGEPPAASAVTSDLAVHASRDQSGDDPHGRFSRSIADKVVKSGEPIVTTSARDDARMAGYVSVHQLMLQSVACVPIRGRAGHVLGALYLETRLRPAQSFSDEIPTLMALADQVAIAIETARLVGENERRSKALAAANEELEVARQRLEELLGHRTAQLQNTRRELRSAKAVLRSHFGYEGLVGTSESMRRVYALIDRVKDTDVPVLITGESGTGKEIVARAIHNAGPRAKKSFVGINCGAIPEHLLESELFGHVRGAFTGADRDRKGLFREATEGTILLDEIGEMPHKMQAGLLRVLQEKVVRPVGGTREEPVDTRVIAATHRDLARMVEAGAFREDLFYRLNVILVRVPPLRERLEDVPILIDHFLGIFAARYGRDRRSVSRAALKRLMSHGWPGNVRQLENVLLNAWVLSDRPELEPDDFELPEAGRATRTISEAMPVSPREPIPSSGRKAPSSSLRRFETSLDEHKHGEKDRILKALASCNWNRVKAAQVVGMPRRTFYRRLKEYGIQ